MEQLRRILATIAKQLGQMNATQKLLVGSLVVIIFMAMFVVSQYSGASQMTDLMPGAPAAEQERAKKILGEKGMTFSERGGAVVVPVGTKGLALATVMQSGGAPADTALLFRNIIQNQSWQMSRQQNEQLYNLALQNELSAVISNFTGIERATIIIDVPDRTGLGKAVLLPTASAMVFTKPGVALSQESVDGIAQLIAGSKAGMRVEDVRVIDGAHGGRQRKPTGDGDSAPSLYLDQAAKVETMMQAKLAEQFSYIPGSIITVTAKVDVTRQKATTTSHLEKGAGTVALVRKTNEKSNTSNQSAPGTEPGLGSNVTADITKTGGRPGSSMNETNEEREMDNHVGTRVEEQFDPKGMPTMLAVSMNVPRSYVVGLLRQSAPAASAAPGAAGAAEPSEADIVKKFNDEVRPAIQSMILPHVLAMSADVHTASDAASLAKVLAGNIAVSLIPLDMAGAGVSGMPGAAGGATSGFGGSGSILALGGGIVDKAILGVLAVAAVGMMLMMVRKAGQKTEMPTAEELVGLPPTLETKTDMIGEADESDTPLAGIEVNETEVAANKMLEQVGELVKKSPEDAAKLLNRWVTVES